MLGDFLKIGDEPELREIPFAHQGVRKAHVILAAYLMDQGKAPKALRHIQESLLHEKPEWLEDVRKALLNVTKKKFWEITDRGVNFEYTDPTEKKALEEFFGWFGAT